MRNFFVYISGFVLLWLLFPIPGVSQCPLNSLGQNPSTAFPVCGTDTFAQKSVNLCGGREVPNPQCANRGLTDINPYWYKFTCFKAGTLGFTINPNSDVSDYDWQVFDITGRNPEDVFTDAKLAISSNWSQYFGATGTSNAAKNIFECDSDVPQLSKMPLLIEGHEYLLLVSHFSNTQAGYKLDFLGGTASITDTVRPAIKSIRGTCDGSAFFIKLSKKMKCSSLAANGSDFKLMPAVANVIDARTPSCSDSFDMDSVVLELDKPIAPGHYTLVVKTGSDGNTLVDNCNNQIAVNDSIGINILQTFPSPFQTVEAAGCAPVIINIPFDRPMLCSSIAPNGSDFAITGPSPVVVASAGGNCSTGSQSTLVYLQLANPIQVGGTYTVTLKKGTDGNTLLNECGKETLPGFVTFKAYDTVSAAINFQIDRGCVADTLRLNNAGRVNITAWHWTFDDGSTSKLQSASRIYKDSIRTTQLVVSNDGCSDTSTLTLDFTKGRIKAAFNYTRFVCPLDSALFQDASLGSITGWQWDFGNGNTSTQQQPPFQFYPLQTYLQEFDTRLVVNDVRGCKDSIKAKVMVPGNCYIAVPSAFTPNGDGLNDYLYPLSAYKAENLNFQVYNRYGQLVWQTNDWTQKWDGRISGNLQASGSYVWHLSYFDPAKNKKFDLKGTTILIR